MTAEVINKVNITAEAVFDYEICLQRGKLDKRSLKAEVEEYIDNMNKSGRLLYDRYFRCKYYDEDSDKMLMLFFYKAERLSIMQFWNLAGICFEEDWSEEAEDNGEIRNWLKCKITDMPKGDWVIEQLVRAEADKIIRGYAVQGSIEGLPKEIKYAIECGNNQELAEALSILQNSGGKRAWRGTLKRKDAVHRKLDKRAKRVGL